MPARRPSSSVEPNARSPRDEWEPEPLQLPVELPACPAGTEVPLEPGDGDDRPAGVIVIGLA